MKKIREICMSIVAVVIIFILLAFIFHYQIIKLYVLHIYLGDEKEKYQIESIEYIGMYDDYRVSLIDKETNKKRTLVIQYRDLSVKYDPERWQSKLIDIGEKNIIPKTIGK